jgi:hypothetical protein
MKQFAFFTGQGKEGVYIANGIKAKYQPVKKDEQEKVLAQIKYAQVEHYANSCDESSGKPVEGRIYDISSGEVWDNLDLNEFK